MCLRKMNMPKSHDQYPDQIVSFWGMFFAFSPKASTTSHIEHSVSIIHLAKNSKGNKINERSKETTTGTTLSEEVVQDI